ncbi:MAG: DUF2662 domain-containing protein [Chloroflexi bacterium]|nr:DUF2662 domain-containing protein [Chloroflexota bacterium]
MIKPEALESRLQALVEVTLARFLPGQKPEDRLSQKLASAMREHARPDENGEVVAPNIFIITANPASLSKWRADKGLLEELGNALHIAGSEAGWKFNLRPTVTTAADRDMLNGETRVLASFSAESIAETLDVPVPANGTENGETEDLPANAFLILHGTKVIPLRQSVINIGRRLDNQVVVDDPRVSRNHAQIRAIKGRFVIFDLNSTGGLYVNGQRSNQSILYPGDVISLAGVTLVFGQDIPTGWPQKNTESDTAPSPGDRPTIVLKTEEESEE